MAQINVTGQDQQDITHLIKSVHSEVRHSEKKNVDYTVYVMTLVNGVTMWYFLNRRDGEMIANMLNETNK